MAETDNHKNADEKPEENKKASSNLLNSLTREDFVKLGLPLSETDSKNADEQEKSNVAKQIADLKQTFSPLVQNKDKKRSTAYDLCLRSLLVELKWPGEERHIVQAMPHFQELDNIVQFRGVLHHLGFATKILSVKGSSLEGSAPCLLMQDEATPMIVLRASAEGKLIVFNGVTDNFEEIDPPKGTVKICVAEVETVNKAALKNRKISWFYEGLRNFNGKIWAIVTFTFIANILALATPIYTMNVYNRVIGSKSLDTLAFFAVAIFAVLAVEIYIRGIRGRLIAYIGARFNTQLLVRGFERILSLPIRMTETASVSQQIVRLRQFENVQTFFTGPLVSAILDLPFTILFVLAISFIHPTLALIPIVLAVVFVLIALFSMPMTKRNVLVTGKARQDNQNLLIETVNKRESVRELRAEEVWIKRWQDINQQFSSRRFYAQFFDMAMHTLAQSLVMVAGIATLWVGAHLVMEEELSVGAMIAVMMFVWRILSPIQTAFLSLNRIGQFSETARQADLLMSLQPERDLGNAPTLRRNYEGRITFDTVSFRYGATGDPVFRGLSVDIPAKQIVAITGDTASGKGTFLKLILGLYRPQAGSVYLDGLNLQQLDVDEVRTSIGYVSQRPEFFYGTVAQNIRLASPAASDSDVEEALSASGVWLPHPQLEEGVDTRLTARKLAGMTIALKQSISLARAFVKKVPIYLLDSPQALLNPFEKQALFDKIEDLKGNATIIITANDDEIISKCDRVLYLRGGAVVFDNTPENYFKARKAAS